MTAPCPPWLYGKTEPEQIAAIIKALSGPRRDRPGVPFLTPHNAVRLLGDVVDRAVAAEGARLRDEQAVSA